LVVTDLEADQNLQDIVLSVFHATTLTFDNTAAVKVIENQLGRAFVKIQRTVQIPLQMVPPPMVPQPTPVPSGPPSSPPQPPGVPETAVRLATRITLRVPQGPTTGLNAIIGRWPGEESDADIERALSELS
jgi:hypothetical protein